MFFAEVADGFVHYIIHNNVHFPHDGLSFHDIPNTSLTQGEKHGWKPQIGAADVSLMRNKQNFFQLSRNASTKS